MQNFSLTRRLVAEGLGTALLVAIVIGSGIMAAALSNGNNAIALLGNTLATGAGLITLILIFGPISGAHFNPVVSLSLALQGGLQWPEFFSYTVVQVIGGLLGTILAHSMFDLPLLQTSTHVRTGTGIWIGEIVAAFGLLITITGVHRKSPEAVPYAVGLFITAGYWFTSSTSFANPAVTIARAFSDTFAGIRPDDIGGFIIAQIIGAIVATFLMRWFYKHSS